MTEDKGASDCRVELGSWCPQMHGTYRAYEPQFLQGEKWVRIPTESVPRERGIPQPLLNGGVNQTLFLFGYEQAQAIAWAFAAEAAAFGKACDVRVQPYEVVYDLKARAIEEPNARGEPRAAGASDSSA